MKTLSASLEDYLEAIHAIEARKGAARVRDIAGALQVSAASVTGALKALATRKMATYAPYEIVRLTRKGRAAAQAICKRHATLREFFLRVLRASPAVADRCACQLEHVLPAEMIKRMAGITTQYATGDSP